MCERYYVETCCGKDTVRDKDKGGEPVTPYEITEILNRKDYKADIIDCLNNENRIIGYRIKENPEMLKVRVFISGENIGILRVQENLWEKLEGYGWEEDNIFYNNYHHFSYIEYTFKPKNLNMRKHK